MYLGPNTEVSWTQFSEAGSYITSAAAPFQVQAGELSLNRNDTLWLDPTNYLSVNVNALTLRSGEDGFLGKSIATGFTGLGRQILFVNTNALAGTGLISYDSNGLGSADGSSEYKLLAVNTNTIATSLAGANLFVNNGDDLNVNVNALVVTSGEDGFGARILFNRFTSLGREAIFVNTNALAGTGLISNDNTGYGTSNNANTPALAVNTNAIAQSLVGTGLYVTNGDDLAVNVNTLATQTYGATSFFIKNDGAEARMSVGYETTNSANTYVTVATIDMGSGTDNPGMFDADIVIRGGSSDYRSSKLTGVLNSASATCDYTEYGIVEVGSAISDVDVKVEFDFSALKFVIKAKATVPGGGALQAAAFVRSVGKTL